MTDIQGELVRALRDRNTILMREIEAMWKVIDVADVAMPASHEEYWTVRAALATLLKTGKKPLPQRLPPVPCPVCSGLYHHAPKCSIGLAKGQP